MGTMIENCVTAPDVGSMVFGCVFYMGVLDYVPDFNLQDWWVSGFDGKVSHLTQLVFSLSLIEAWGCKYVFYVHKFFILQDFAS